MKDIPSSWIDRIHFVEMSVLPKQRCYVNDYCFAEKENTIPKLIWCQQQSGTAKSNVSLKNKAERITLSHFEAYYRVLVRECGCVV